MYFVCEIISNVRTLGVQQTKILQRMLLDAFEKTWHDRRKNIQEQMKTYKELILKCCQDPKLVSKSVSFVSN